MQPMTRTFGSTAVARGYSIVGKDSSKGRSNVKVEETFVKRSVEANWSCSCSIVGSILDELGDFGRISLRLFYCTRGCNCMEFRVCFLFIQGPNKRVLVICFCGCCGMLVLQLIWPIFVEVSDDISSHSLLTRLVSVAALLGRCHPRLTLCSSCSVTFLLSLLITNYTCRAKVVNSTRLCSGGLSRLPMNLNKTQPPLPKNILLISRQIHFMT